MFVRIGVLFKYKETLYRVVESHSCDKCAFKRNSYCHKLRDTGSIPRCGEGGRTDKKSVAFVKSKDIKGIIDLD